MNWDLRFAVPPGVGRGGGGGEEEAAAISAPARRSRDGRSCRLPSHDIGPRGPHVAPGTFKVALDVDGVVSESRTFEVRADPGSTITLTQHKAREAFEIEVMDLLAKIETLATDLGKRRAAASGDAAARLRALEQRLIGGGGRASGRAERRPPTKANWQQAPRRRGLRSRSQAWTRRAAGAPAPRRVDHRVRRLRRADGHAGAADSRRCAKCSRTRRWNRAIERRSNSVALAPHAPRPTRSFPPLARAGWAKSTKHATRASIGQSPSLPAARRRPAVPRALRSRSARDLAADPSAHLHPLRRRRAQMARRFS